VLTLTASVFGAALIGPLGWLLVRASLRVGDIEKPAYSPATRLAMSFTESLARLSYDLPFSIRRPIEIPGVCIVYMDEKASRSLQTDPTAWDRALHARLLRRLTNEGARAVVFDIVFSNPGPDAAVDDDFAAAIRENGRVFLGGALEISRDWSEEGSVLQERVLPPVRTLRAAAAGWGLLAFRPVDADYGVRRIYTGTETVPAATWRAALQLGAPLPDSPSGRAEPRWMNYYGPPRSFPSVGYDRALATDGVPAGYFKDRIVFIGGRPTLSQLGLGKDEFHNPYSVLGAELFGAEFSDGVEVHLTNLVNLLRGDWLRRLDARREVWLALSIGLLLGGLLPLLRPHTAAFAAFLGLAAVVAFALWEFNERHIWFAWCIPALVQTPLALAWAVGARYFLEERRRNALRDAFGHYLSPQMADRIADADFDLAPGGVVVEASLLITDLEGFTPLAEKLSDPNLVSRVLIDYFSITTSHILANDGTIINLVGDAVFAVWGTLLGEKDHARKAALAAWRLHQSSRIEVEGRPLRTRVGLHTGPVLAGNIGSAERFDYAVVGDAVNFTSRLEGLNKNLGTDILMSGAFRQKVADRFVTRRLGDFRLLGKTTEHTIHELLGPAESVERPAWVEVFEKGLDAFQKGDLDGADATMNEVIALRGGKDGPSEFYRREIAAWRAKGLPSDWAGVVELATK
jgi:adenylate cyclase